MPSSGVEQRSFVVVGPGREDKCKGLWGSARVPSRGCGCWAAASALGAALVGEGFPMTCAAVQGGGSGSPSWLGEALALTLDMLCLFLAVFTPLVLRPTFSLLAEPPDHVPNAQLSCGLLPFPALVEREGFNPLTQSVQQMVLLSSCSLFTSFRPPTSTSPLPAPFRAPG